MENVEGPCIHCQKQQIGDPLPIYSSIKAKALPIKQKPFFQHMEFRSVIEASRDCIFIWDEQCTCLYASRAAIDYLQMTSESVVGKSICQIKRIEPVESWKSRIESVLKNGTVQHFSETTEAGHKLVYSEVVLSPVWNSDGKCFAVVMIYRDISHHKETEIQLRASQERLKRFSETTFEAIVIHKGGTVLDANQKFFDMFGYTFEEFRRLDGYELITLPYRQMVKEKIDSGCLDIHEAMAIRKDGTVFPIEIQARSCQVDGVAVRIAAIKDLTRRKEMQQQVVESEKKYRELYDLAAIPLYRTRISDGKMIECNHMLAVMLGYDSKEECLREHYSVKHYVNPAHRAELLEILKKEKSVTKYEIEFLRRNGAHAWAEITARINEEQGYIEGGQIDITAARVLGRIEKEILQLILQGKSNKEIAQLAHRSIRTVEDHRSNIMKKMGVSNLVELVKIGQYLTYRTEK